MGTVAPTQSASACFVRRRRCSASGRGAVCGLAVLLVHDCFCDVPIAARGRRGSHVRGNGIDDLCKRLGLERLQQMMVEAGFPNPPPVVVLAIAGERHENDVPGISRLAQLPRQLVSVDLR